jgi:endo-1,4-beta-mannosidase
VSGVPRNPAFPVGVDLYPLSAERLSPEDWYAEGVEADLDAIAQAGLWLVRLFVSWRCLEPQVGQYDEEMFDRLDAVIGQAKARGLKVVVCFFADDRLAELAEVPWGKKRDARTDDYLVQREVALVQRIVNRYRTETAVHAWDLANEAFCAGFSSEEDLEAWVRTLREAVREVDPDRPIWLGVDAETFLRETGVDARPAIDFAEAAMSHLTGPYRAYIAEGPLTSGPSTYVDGFLARSALRDLPVVVDGIGVHSLDFSVAEEAAYVRTALFSSLMNRASGVLVRRWRDVETERREPYFRDPFEVLVGLTDVSGAPKPVVREVRAFARTVAAIDFGEFSLAPERAAVLVPSERYEPLPSLAGLYAPRACLQSYIAAKEAHLPVAVAREGDEIGGFQALIVPSAFKLAPETWRRLAAFVQGGGSLVLSYGGGDADPAVREIFGVEFLGDHGPRRRFSCRVAQPGVLGAIASFDAEQPLPSFALLAPKDALVVATDENGSPLATVRQHGQGRAVFLATPIERAIAQADPWATPAPVRSFVREVYGSVARAAGAGPVVECDAPEVEVAHFLGDGRDIVVLLVHNAVQTRASLTFGRTVAAVADVRGSEEVEVGATTFEVPLPPNGAAALQVIYAKQG